MLGTPPPTVPLVSAVTLNVSEVTVPSIRTLPHAAVSVAPAGGLVFTQSTLVRSLAEVHSGPETAMLTEPVEGEPSVAPGGVLEASANCAWTTVARVTGFPWVLVPPQPEAYRTGLRTGSENETVTVPRSLQVALPGEHPVNLVRMRRPRVVGLIGGSNMPDVASTEAWVSLSAKM